MIRVLVAEDELPLLRGIHKMIEMLNPEFVVVKEARNGREALDYLQGHTVDVVFTDINMPLVDGMELLKYTSEICPSVLTVVISGYREFSYAQTALRYQARNYLLKPVDKEELSELLSRLEEEIKSRAGEEKNKVLTDILFGGRLDPIGADLFDRIYPVYFSAGAFAVNSVEESVPGNGYWRQNDLKEEVAKLLDGEKGVFCFYGKSLNEQILLLERREALSIGELTKTLLGLLHDSLPVTAAYAEAVTDINQVQEALNRLRKEIRLKGIFGKNMVVNESTEREAFKLSLSTEAAFQHAMQKEQSAELEEILQYIRDQMKSAEVTQRDLEQVLQKLFDMAAASGAGRNDGGNREGCLDLSELFSYAFDLDRVFAEFTLLCRDMRKETETEGSREMMKLVDEYIMAHRNEPITTKLLASKFGLVSPYLSKLFKDYKGITPAQYLQDIRLNSAKELLINCPDIMSKDIAEMVGYQNPLYFSKTFKKNVGVYPSEYRAENGKIRISTGENERN